MGKKEQKHTAKRAAERAASNAPPCKAAAPKPPAMQQPTAADILGSWTLVHASSTSSGASEPESTVAGSGNPASSVSSGRAEAEGWKWEYKEGRNGGGH